MTDFVRPIQERIEDFFILDIEALRDITDNLEYHIPDSLCESKLHATPSSIHKESAYGDTFIFYFAVRVLSEAKRPVAERAREVLECKELPKNFTLGGQEKFYEKGGCTDCPTPS